MKLLLAIFVSLSLIASGAAGLLFLANTQLGNEVVTVTEQVEELEAELAKLPQLSEGNHLIEVNELIKDIDCPRFTPDGSVDSWNHAAPCALKVDSDYVHNAGTYGVHKIVGEYVRYEKKDHWAVEVGEPEGTMATCDALRVVSSEPNITDAIKESTLGGNSVNMIDDNGHLLLNIDLRYLPEFQVERIKAATGTIAIAGFVDIDRPGVAGTCGSFIEHIISLEIE